MKVMEAVLSGDRATAGTPCSSAIMVSIQRLRCSGDHVDGGLERFAFEALGVKDLSDLIALAFRR